MSNSRYAYGWVGHVLVSSDDDDSSDLKSNRVSVDGPVYDKIYEDWGNMKLPSGVEANRLGTDDYSTGLAIGFGFTDGGFSGEIFKVAEERSGANDTDHSPDVAYMTAMESVYGLRLPTPPKIMVGCYADY